MTLPLSYSRRHNSRGSPPNRNMKEIEQHQTKKAKVNPGMPGEGESGFTAKPWNLELMTGIEPVTSPLPRECSTD